ncbi:MAG: hypothetical protein GY947_20250 [Rhodobacteraceae bacterium]|nr:hypothetical protein [Paracoccaceae bacterium]
MYHFLVVCLIFASVLPGSSQCANAQEVFFYRLQTDRLLCVKTHRQKYLDLPGDEFLISLSSCPLIPQNPLSGSLVNEGPKLNLVDDESADTLIAVTRKQLTCLTEKPIEPQRSIHRFYPQDCRLEAEDD